MSASLLELNLNRILVNGFGIMDV